MKYGIYYAYWAREWGGDFLPFISKVKRLGFDVLEVNCGSFPERDDSYFRELRRVSEGEGVLLSGGYGPRPEHNLSSADPALIEGAFRFWADVFHKMELSGIDRVGGALYSYWPVDFRNGFNKAEDTQRSIENIRKLAGLAAVHGITLNMEVLNRFEGYMLNECEEAVCYVKAVGNRRPPSAQGRIPWKNIGQALKDVGYDQYVVMEPFERMGGQVGKDISIWRDLSHGATEKDLDVTAAQSVEYIRSLWG